MSQPLDVKMVKDDSSIISLFISDNCICNCMARDGFSG
jgi:hypothetical protein